MRLGVDDTTEIRQRLKQQKEDDAAAAAAAAASKQRFSLDWETRIPSDFLRPDEVVTFKKKKKGTSKTKTKMRKPKLVLDEPSTFEEHRKGSWVNRRGVDSPS